MPFSIGFGVGPIRWSHRLGGRRRRSGGTAADAGHYGDDLRRRLAEQRARFDASPELQRRRRINRVAVPVFLLVVLFVLVILVMG